MMCPPDMSPATGLLLVDCHGSDDCLDVADIVEVEIEAHDLRLGCLTAQLLVDALLKPDAQKQNIVVDEQAY